MIFDFKDHLTKNLWHKSDLVTSPPKTINDYILTAKSFIVDNSSLAIPFVVAYAVLASLNYYSHTLNTRITSLADSHRLYQDRRTAILTGKRQIDAINTFVSSLSPYISDSIYPNLFLSLLSPIIPIDSSISQLSLTKNSSSLRLISSNTNFLSSAFSTLDQHPLIQTNGISFTSIKSSSDNTTSQPASSGSSVLNEIDIKFSYDYADVST